MINDQGIDARLVTRSGPLNWPQEAQWVYISFRRLDNIYPIFQNGWYVRDDVTVAQASEALRRITQDHEILRTVFGFGADGSAVQYVLSYAETRIGVFPIELAEGHLKTPPKPFTDGPPTGTPLWKADLYTAGDQVRGVLITAEHVVFDGAGMASWENQFGRLVRGEPPVQGQGQIRHPLDHPDTSRRRRKPADPSVERRRPLITVPAIEQPSPQRYLFAQGTFGDLLATVDKISERYSCSRPTVIMLLVALLFSHHARQDVIHVCPIICDKPANDASIECRMYSIDVEFAFSGGRRVSDQLGLASRAVLSAYADDSRSPLDELEDALAYAVSRGGVARRGPIFNFVSLHSTSPSSHSGGADGQADVQITDKWLDEDEPYAIAITVQVIDDRLAIEYGVDTAMHSAEVTHQMLRCLPVLAREVLEWPDRPIGELTALRGVDRFDNRGMCRVGPDWISLPALRELLAGSPGVRDVALEIEDDGELVARISSDGTVSGSDLHDRVATMLWDRTDLIAPVRYVITAGDQPGGATVFEPARGAGSTVPETPAELALAVAFKAANGHAAADLTLPYFSAGGRLAAVPMFIESVLDQGYAGLQTGQIQGPVTLKSIAASLRRVASD